MTNTEGSTGFRNEGEPAFKQDTEKDTTAASSAEKTETEQTGSQDQGEGKSAAAQDAGGAKEGEGSDFAKHPRWIEREADWKTRFNDQESRHVSEISKLRAEFEAKFGQGSKGQDQNNAGASEEVPGWFGGDAKQWKEFKAWNESLVAGASKGAVTEIEQKAQKQEAAVKEATDFLNAEIKVIETDKTLNPKGEKVDRNKLFKIALDNELVDTKGRWNYRAAWRIMQAAGGSVASNTQARKEVAGATVSGNKPEPKPASFTTSEDFSKPGARPW